MTILGMGRGLPGLGMLILNGSRSANRAQSSGSRENIPPSPVVGDWKLTRATRSWRSSTPNWRENSSSESSRLGLRASRPWTVEGDGGQMVIRYGRERSDKLTSWPGSGLTGDWNSQGVEVESTEGEGDESGFGEHHDKRSRREGRITTAPGLKQVGERNWGELHSG